MSVPPSRAKRLAWRFLPALGFGLGTVNLFFADRSVAAKAGAALGSALAVVALVEGIEASSSRLRRRS